MLPHVRYEANVRDPKTGTTAHYKMLAVSDAHADRQARDGFTGLFGSYEKVQERLEVEVWRV